MQPEAISRRTMDLVEESARAVVSDHQKKMARYLFEIARMQGVNRLRESGTLPAQALKVFRKVMELYDESSLYYLGRLHHQGIVVRCRPGCPHCCCNMPSGVSTMELIYLYHGLCLSGKASRLFRRCIEAQEQWAGVLQRGFESLAPNAHRGCSREESLQSYQVLSWPCPFLQDSSCLVYPFRPLACRMHYSLSTPQWCNPSHFQHDYAVRFNLEPGDCVHDALEHLDERFGLNISDIMICGLLEVVVNLMRFNPIRWI